MNKNITMDKIVAFAKDNGFVFAGSEIYGGLANAWDFGPLGVELKNNVKKVWWDKFVKQNPMNYGLDSAILMNPSVWQASGHLSGFSDPLMDCKECKSRHRADQLISEYINKNALNIVVEDMSDKDMENFIETNKVACPYCKKSNFTPIRKFNLMFKTFQGVTEDSSNIVYLRPETAQGIFVNFKNIQRSMRAKLPFGVCQIGKSFRNEITPGNFIFRTREFEQMEMEFFCAPNTDLEWFNYWKNYYLDFFKEIGINPENLRYRDHSKEELAFYSKATTDIDYHFPFGWSELMGIADRTDYDLSKHQTSSGKNLEYIDPVTNERFLPYVIEPSLGVERTVLISLIDAYTEEQLTDDTRIVLKLNPNLSPYKLAVFPLIKKNHSEKAKEILAKLSKKYMCAYDESASIGKRYRRQDEIGTPLCITIDDETLNNSTVTIRDRDTMKQDVVNVNELYDYIEAKLNLI